MTKTLGRGLQSLIPKKQSKISNLIKNEGSEVNLGLSSKKDSIFNIEVNKIKPNPNQPRKELSQESLKELAESIKEHGVLQPLIVTKIEKSTNRGHDVEYELIAGERRWRASKMAGLPHVPVIIRGKAIADRNLEIALVENIQRENLNPIDSALAFKRLQDEFKLRHKDIVNSNRWYSNGYCEKKLFEHGYECSEYPQKVHTCSKRHKKMPDRVVVR